MSHFYGTLKGNRGEGSRCGSKNSGMRTTCGSWQGGVCASAWYNEEKDEDFVRVSLIPWHGAGTSRVLYEGPISGKEVKNDQEN